MPCRRRSCAHRVDRLGEPWRHLDARLELPPRRGPVQLQPHDELVRLEQPPAVQREIGGIATGCPHMTPPLRL
jgi:hypothetical protein